MLPPFNEDAERLLPARVVELKAHIREADAILIATPECNYSVPGVLKNAIDWPRGRTATTPGTASRSRSWGRRRASLGPPRTVRQTFVFFNMHPVNRPEVMLSNAAQRFDAHGRLVDEGSRTRIRQLLEALVVWTRRLGG